VTVISVTLQQRNTIKPKLVFMEKIEFISPRNQPEECNENLSLMISINILTITGKPVFQENPTDLIVS